MSDSIIESDRAIRRLEYCTTLRLLPILSFRVDIQHIVHFHQQQFTNHLYNIDKSISLNTFFYREPQDLLAKLSASLTILTLSPINGGSSTGNFSPRIDPSYSVS